MSDVCPKCGSPLCSEGERERLWECGSFELFQPLPFADGQEVSVGFHQVVNDCRIRELEQQLAAAQADAARWKEQAFHPLGDNHHNAKECPYCSGAALSAPAREEREDQECDRCDGCGWYEGGPTLKTLCDKCEGTGIIRADRQGGGGE